MAVKKRAPPGGAEESAWPLCGGQHMRELRAEHDSLSRACTVAHRRVLWAQAVAEAARGAGEREGAPLQRRAGRPVPLP